MPGEVVPARAPRRRVRRLEPVASTAPVVTALPTQSLAGAPMGGGDTQPPTEERQTPMAIAAMTRAAETAVAPMGEPGTAETLARAYTARAVDTLGTLMEADYKEGTRLAAALALLDRGWGKIGSAAKEEAHDGDDGFDPAEGRERLARELDRLARREGADAPAGPADGS